MNKSQSVILRELFAFAMGVLLMTVISSIFFTDVSTGIGDYSLNEQAGSLLFHVNSLIEKAFSLTQSTLNTSTIIIADMPSSLVKQPYSLTVTGNELCLSTKGLSDCINLTVSASVNGSFSSSHDLMITGFLSGNTVFLVIDNY